MEKGTGRAKDDGGAPMVRCVSPGRARVAPERVPCGGGWASDFAGAVRTARLRLLSRIASADGARSASVIWESRWVAHSEPSSMISRNSTEAGMVVGQARLLAGIGSFPTESAGRAASWPEPWSWAGTLTRP